MAYFLKKIVYFCLALAGVALVFRYTPKNWVAKTGLQITLPPAAVLPATSTPVAIKKPAAKITATPAPPAKPKPVSKPKPTFTAGGALVGPTSATGGQASGATTLSVAGVITLTNQERTALNLGSLRENSLLNSVAAKRVTDMFDNQYFAHNSPSGTAPSDVARASGYSYLNFGENIALGNFAGNRELVTAWMNSPHHRENIVNTSFTEIGVAVGEGIFKGEKTWIAVQVFGRPRSACPDPSEPLRAAIQTKTAEADAREADLAKRKDELDRMPHSSQAEVDAYNQKADEFNALAKELNALLASLKLDIAAYNKQVNAFNACLGN